MSAQTRTIITCDTPGCPNKTGTGEVNQTAQGEREAAKAKGWTRVGSGDRCPACRQRIAAHNRAVPSVHNIRNGRGGYPE